MNFLIISQNTKNREEALLKQVELISKREFKSFQDLFKNPDIHVLSKEGNEAIKIEDIHKLQSELMFKPFQEDFQIGIIYNAQNLTNEAQNALLKTLEDASSYTHFILSIDKERNILQTIRSRMSPVYPTQQTISNQDNVLVNEFLNLDFHEKLEWVEHITKELSKNEILQFLNQLIQVYHQSSKDSLQISKTEYKRQLEQEEIVIKAYSLLKTTNVNSKGTLWNMVIQLYL